ncbi:DUF4175 family protein [Planctomicrobium sp. SH661]|uniref:DUF4175 family protein n=1 Tax=Planctomicrobium sp. SH661 TaxID=3448124 RepID=UPI003F5B8A32
MPPDLRIPDVLLQQLRQLRNRIVGVSVADGIGLTLLVVSINVAIVLGLDLLFDLPLNARVGLVATVPVCAAGVIIWKILRPLAARYQSTELAVVVEEAHPELRERLLSVVELQAASERGEDAGSELMRSKLVQQTVDFASTHAFADSVDATRAIRRCWLGGIAFFALLLPLVFATNAYAVLLSRFLNPWGNYERLQNLVLTVDNADRVVGRGDDVLITARPSWRFREGTLPQAAWLEWTHSIHNDGDGAGPASSATSRRMDWNDAEKCYSVVLPRVDTAFDFTVSADGSRTRRHRIDVVDRPEVTRFSVDITPPAYTGAAASHHDALLGEILALEQSQLKLELTFNKPVVEAEFLWLEGETPAARGRRSGKDAELVDGSPVRSRTVLPLAPHRTSASLNMIAALDGPSGRFVVRTRDEHGLQARVEPLRRLTIQPDQPPVIAFADNEQHASARPQDLLRIPLQASDDYGLSIVELHYELLRNSVKESGIIPVAPADLTGKFFRGDVTLNLDRLQATHGMQVAIRARATDGRPVPGPNETWTGTRLIQILEDAKPYGEQTLADSQHRMDQAMDNLKGEIEKQRQTARQLQTEAQTNEARREDWNADDRAAALEDQIRDLSQQMQKLSAVMEQKPLFQPLAEEARKIAERELAQAAAKVDEAREAALPQKQQKLSDAADRLQKAEESLKKIQEKHHQLAQTQRELLELNRLAENTEQLAEQVDELIQKQPRTPAEQGAESNPQRELWNQDHQRLVSRHQQLERDLDKVLQDHPDLLEKARENLQHQLAALGEQADQLARQQQALANSNREAARQKAQESGLRQKQDQLLQDEKQLAEALKLPTSEEMSVHGTQETRQARQNFEEGNFTDSKEQHSQAQKQLEQLANALRENQKLPTDPGEAAQALKDRLQALSEQVSQLPPEATADSQAEMSRLAAEQSAFQRAIAEIPPTESLQELRQQVMDRTQEAARQLAGNHQPAAQDQLKQAEEAMNKLAEAIQAALQEPSQKEAMAAENVQAEIQKERARTQELSEKASELARQQQAMTDEIANFIRAQEESMAATPTEQSGEKNPADASSPADLADAQQDLAAESRMLGEEVRDLGLNQENVNRTSSEFPNVARAASHELGEANFQRAAERAKEAAEKAREFADVLAQQANDTIPERLRDQAARASQQQQALADQLQALADSPQQQAAFRSQRQEQLQQRSKQLAQELSTRAEQLGLKQIDRPAQSETAKQGEDQLKQANDLLQESIHSEQAGNVGQAAESALKAAEALRQAANLSRQASNGGNAQRAPENPAQGEAGQQVAESSQHLNQAGQQLARLGEPMQTTESPSREQAPQESDSEKSTSDNGEKQMAEDSSGEHEMRGGDSLSEEQATGQSDASQSLRQAAQNMRHAAHQMGLSANAQRTNGPQPPNGRDTNESTGSAPNDTASNGDANLRELQNSLGKVSGRDWGKLPGTLQTELLESSQRQRDAAYGSLIRKYFEEISKARSPELNESPRK